MKHARDKILHPLW